MKVCTCQSSIDREALKRFEKTQKDEAEYTFTEGKEELPDDFFNPLTELLLELF